MQDVYKVLTIEGRENPSGQPSTCMVCTHFEIGLDDTHIKGDFPRHEKHVAKFKFVSLKDKSAFEAGKNIDNSMTTTVRLPIAGDDLQGLFDTVFATLMPLVAAELGATVEDAVFGVPDEN
jgi:hypothetical protein